MVSYCLSCLANCERFSEQVLASRPRASDGSCRAGSIVHMGSTWPCNSSGPHMTPLQLWDTLIISDLEFSSSWIVHKKMRAAQLFTKGEVFVGWNARWLLLMCENFAGVAWSLKCRGPNTAQIIPCRLVGEVPREMYPQNSSFSCEWD